MEPTCKKYDDGTEEWLLSGVLHRADGPAYIGRQGFKSWWLHGERHREDGPAITREDGSASWYLHGLRVEPFTQEQLPLILLSITDL